ncbi:MAG: hypothetical protein J6E44_05570, partial [Lachnospiraceae bacterium]|nr:hypothetical protein [Lachnospiraceae bacterium]
TLLEVFFLVKAVSRRCLKYTGSFFMQLSKYYAAGRQLKYHIEKMIDPNFMSYACYTKNQNKMNPIKWTRKNIVLHAF